VDGTGWQQALCRPCPAHRESLLPPPILKALPARWSPAVCLISVSRPLVAWPAAAALLAHPMGLRQNPHRPEPARPGDGPPGRTAASPVNRPGGLPCPLAPEGRFAIGLQLELISWGRLPPLPAPSRKPFCWVVRRKLLPQNLGAARPRPCCAWRAPRLRAIWLLHRHADERTAVPPAQLFPLG